MAENRDVKQPMHRAYSVIDQERQPVPIVN